MAVYTYSKAIPPTFTEGRKLTLTAKPKVSPKKKALALIVKIAKGNLVSASNRTRQVEPNAEFITALYTALASKKIIAGNDTRIHAMEFGVSVFQFQVCAKRSTVNGHGVMRPELAVWAIMKKLIDFDKSLANVGYVRYAKNGTPLASNENDDNAYRVMLFRK